MKISEIQAGLRSLNVAVDVDDLQRYLDSARISVEDVTEATIEAIADEIKKVQSTAIAPTTPSTAITPKRKGGKLAKVKQDNSIAPHAQQVQTNAQAMAKSFTNRGYHIISGGTDNHLLLIDLRNKNITGKKAQETLDRAHITLNKNAVPYDDKSPFVTSGIRVGVPAITTRGMVETDMEKVVALVDKVLMNLDNETVVGEVRDEVQRLMNDYPLYAELGWEA